MGYQWGGQGKIIKSTFTLKNSFKILQVKAAHDIILSSYVRETPFHRNASSSMCHKPFVVDPKTLLFIVITPNSSMMSCLYVQTSCGDTLNRICVLVRHASALWTLAPEWSNLPVSPIVMSHVVAFWCTWQGQQSAGMTKLNRSPGTGYDSN